jgi:hypothetical protein
MTDEGPNYFTAHRRQFDINDAHSILLIVESHYVDVVVCGIKTNKLVDS